MLYVLWWQICNFLLVSFVIIQRKFGCISFSNLAKVDEEELRPCKLGPDR